MCAKTMRVPLQQAHTFLLDQHLGGIGAVFRHLIPVADVEIPDTDEVVGELAGELVAGDVLDLEPLQVKDVGHGQARQTVEFTRVLDEIFAQPEFVVAFDPGDARARQGVRSS